MKFYSLKWYREDGTGQTGAQCFASDAKSALRKLKKECLNKYSPVSALGGWVLSIDNNNGEQLPIQYSK